MSNLVHKSNSCAMCINYKKFINLHAKELKRWDLYNLSILGLSQNFQITEVPYHLVILCINNVMEASVNDCPEYVLRKIAGFECQ